MGKLAKYHEFNFSSVKALPSSPASPVAAKRYCTHCAQPATFFVSQVNAQGQVAAQNFCLFHALKAGLFNPHGWDLLGTLSPAKAPLPALRAAKPIGQLACRCGMTSTRLKEKGRPGCPNCYRVFAHLFRPALPQLHGASVHAGKAPVSARPRINVRSRIETLHAALQQAVKSEAYEEAAKVRDELSELKKLFS